MQRRLKKYTRDPNTLAAVASRQITKTSLAIIATIHDYGIVPTSLLVRLVPGHEKNIYRHLQQLYHKAMVNRFAFMRGKNPSEFYYYLDNPAALELLALNGVEKESLKFEIKIVNVSQIHFRRSTRIFMQLCSVCDEPGTIHFYKTPLEMQPSLPLG